MTQWEKALKANRQNLHRTHKLKKNPESKLPSPAHRHHSTHYTNYTHTHKHRIKMKGLLCFIQQEMELS